jgi:hypothetical protein
LTRTGLAQPGPTKFFLGPGGPVHKIYWAGRAKIFLGPARPDVLSFILLFL